MAERPGHCRRDHQGLKAELVTERSDFAEKLSDVSAEVKGVPQDEVCKFSRYVDMQKAAAVMVGWLTSAPEDSP